MKRHISFPDIEQYRSVVHKVKQKTAYQGVDAEGNVIFDYSIPCPTLNFIGTTKLHGTNASAVKDADELWAQSKDSLIDPVKDNAGFAMFVQKNKEVFEQLFKTINKLDKTIVISGEWCGKGIQKGMSISALPKMFVVFSIAVIENEGGFAVKKWFTKEQVVEIMSHNSLPEIKCIYDFPHWEMEIDFNAPHEYQNELTELTLAVEEECPVGKQLGSTGIGEGIVWKCITEGFLDSGFWFKVKGEKHSAKSKVKTIAPVDVEKINNIKELVEKLTPEWRLEQMCSKTFNTLNGGKIDIKGMGEFIKNMMQDILKEELDTLSASGFTTKDITSTVAAKCRVYLSEQLKDFNK